MSGLFSRGTAQRRMPAKPCIRCARPTTIRRDGRPVCLHCWIELSERKQDKEMRSMGKLKGTRGSPK